MIYQKGANKQLTRNFNSSEFDCKCDRCNITLIDKYLVLGLQSARDEIRQALWLTNSYRCEAHNKEIGGSVTSFHMAGKAADIMCPLNMGIYDFEKILKKYFEYVKVYVGGNFCHVQTDLHAK